MGHIIAKAGKDQSHPTLVDFEGSDLYIVWAGQPRSSVKFRCLILRKPLNRNVLLYHNAVLGAMVLAFLPHHTVTGSEGSNGPN